MVPLAVKAQSSSTTWIVVLYRNLPLTVAILGKMLKSDPHVSLATQHVRVDGTLRQYGNPLDYLQICPQGDPCLVPAIMAYVNLTGTFRLTFEKASYFIKTYKPPSYTPNQKDPVTQPVGVS